MLQITELNTVIDIMGDEAVTIEFFRSSYGRNRMINESRGGA
jgi:hypothetical protein